MAPSIIGRYNAKMSRDTDGHREYRLTYLIESATTAGPTTVLTETPDLPQPGDLWLFGDDTDVWAFCKQDVTVTPHQQTEKEPNRHWTVELLFSTKPDEKRCKSTQIEDPLMVPDRISWSSSKYQEEYTVDRFNKPIMNSALERLHGPQVEFDRHRTQIVIEQNTFDLEFSLCDSMVNTVNRTPLWGYPARCVKLCEFTAQKFYQGRCGEPEGTGTGGATGGLYFTRKFTFEASVRLAEKQAEPKTGTGQSIDAPETSPASGWDRDLLDEGTRVLHGKWLTDIVGGKRVFKGTWVTLKIDGKNPDPRDPRSFDRAVDLVGNPIKITLDGHGRPAGVKLEGASVVTVLTTRPLANTTFSPSAQPTQRVQLIINITDSDNSVESGLIKIIGQNEHGQSFDPEVIDISDAGTMTYKSQYEYSTVTSFEITDLAGNTSADTIEVVTSGLVMAAGKIHVEAYQESDFLLLGVPTSLT